MAKNTGLGYRKGAVRNRCQMPLPSGGWAKRIPGGRFLAVKASPWKGVRKC